MRLKELERFAFTSWSPAFCDPPFLGAITAAEQMNDDNGPTDTSSNSVLELFQLNLQDSTLQLQPTFQVEVDSKSTCLCWTSPTAGAPVGLLIAGNVSGGLSLYNPEVLISGTDASGVTYATKETIHSGAVRSVDSNRFQTNLFASVADEAELLIWDVEKMDQPMSPGGKIQPFEPLTTVAWNPRVQHILATASAGHCTIWDLRRSDPVVHLTKAMCQFEPHLMAWSPDVATRLCLADPAHPTADIQLWDLRYPKHQLALLARWPPCCSGPLGQAALGNAATINALAWSPGSSCQQPIPLSKPGLGLNESDLIAVSLTASGALPTVGGGCGSNLQPASGDFLVVWSVDEALQSVQADPTSNSNSLQPVFVGRIEDTGSDTSNASPSMGGLPNNSAVHWLPTQPGLLSVTQSEGWITLFNLDAGPDASWTEPSKRMLNDPQSPHISRARQASHKVAEAFGEEVDLSNSPPCDNLDNLATATGDMSLSNIPVSDRWDSPDESLVSHKLSKRAHSLPQLPQPLPRLRLAPRWMKRPSGVSFSFGGRLVSFVSNEEAARRARSSLSQSGTPADSVTDVATAAVSTSGNCIQLQWVDTISCKRLAGLHYLTGVDDADAIQSLRTWLFEALWLPVTELGNVCEGMKQLCKPGVVKCGNKPPFNPWEILKVRLHSSDEMTVILSGLLGYCHQTVSDHIDTALTSVPEPPSDLDCSCHDPESRKIAFSHLDVLKMALVTANHSAVIRLCMHSSLSSVPFPGISPLSALAVLLATQTGEKELFTETQQSVLSNLISVTKLPKAEQLHMSWIPLLVQAILHNDWSVVAHHWPLKDWTIGLAAIVNHTWPRNPALFQSLCDILTDRLLDVSPEVSQAQEEVYTAAWICAVLAGNLSNLVRVWWIMNAMDTEKHCGEQLLPLVLQLIMVRKYATPREPQADNMPDSVPTVSKIFSNIALWLGQTSSGRSSDDNMAALQLLHELTAGSQHLTLCPEVNEVAHRLWCGLSNEERHSSSFQFNAPFYCPYQQSSPLSSIKRCLCGRAASVVDSLQPHVTRHFPRMPQTVSHPLSVPPTVGHPSSAIDHVPPPLGSIPFIPVSNQNSTTVPPKPPVQFYAPSAPVQPPSLPTPVQPIQSQCPPSGPRIWSHPSITATSTVAQSYNGPPSMQRNVNEPFRPQPFNNTPPTIPGVSAISNAEPPRSNMPPGVHMPDFGSASTLPPPPPPATTRAWNDPPLLANTYKPPVRPAVSVNHFYNPTQFATQPTPTGPPNWASSQDQNLSGAPLIPPISHNMQQGCPPSITPTVPIPPMAFCGPPMMPSAPINSPMMEPMHPPPALNQPVRSSEVNTLGTSIFPPGPPYAPYSSMQPLGGDELSGEVSRLKNATPTLLPTTMHLHRSAGVASDQWPAAQPLGVSSPQSDAFVREPVNQWNQSQNDAAADAAPPEINNKQINPEFEAIEQTLSGLIQLCRSVGGKQYTIKLDTVERRLGSLFSTLRGGGGGPVLSDVVLQHLQECVHAANQSNFPLAVERANVLIQSAAGFESIHGFAPGLKILMQTARQLFPPNSQPYSVTGEQHFLRAM